MWSDGQAGSGGTLGGTGGRVSSKNEQKFRDIWG